MGENLTLQLTQLSDCFYAKRAECLAFEASFLTTWFHKRGNWEEWGSGRVPSIRAERQFGKFLVNPLKGGLMLQDWCVGMPTKTTVVLLNGITVMKGRESIHFCQSVQTQSEFDSYYKADRLSQTVPDYYFYSIKCPSGLYLNAQCLLDFIFSVLMCSVCPLSKMTPLCRDWTSLDIYKLERWS